MRIGLVHTFTFTFTISLSHFVQEVTVEKCALDSFTLSLSHFHFYTFARSLSHFGQEVPVERCALGSLRKCFTYKEESFDIKVIIFGYFTFYVNVEL